MKSITTILTFLILLTSCGANDGNNSSIQSPPVASERDVEDISNQIESTSISCSANSTCSPSDPGVIILSSGDYSNISISEDGMSLVNENNFDVEALVEVVSTEVVNAHLEQIDLKYFSSIGDEQNLVEGLLRNSNCTQSTSGILLRLPESTKIISLPSLKGFTSSNSIIASEQIVMNAAGDILKSYGSLENLIITDIEAAEFLLIKFETLTACEEVALQSLNIKTISY